MLNIRRIIIHSDNGSKWSTNTSNKLDYILVRFYVSVSLFVYATGRGKAVYISPSLDPTLALLLVGYTEYDDDFCLCNGSALDDNSD
ncbi:hypothetical protein Hanom_Chr06g00492941 [Helianthus anomalus]